MTTDQTSIRALIALVREQYVPDSPTHDHSHLQRVANLSSHICRTEGGSILVATCAAWLHDLHREAGGDFFVPPEAMDDRARALMATSGIPCRLHKAILDAIHYTDRYSFSDRLPYEATAEARAVRDADMLDAVGAIGIARAFSFGGAHNIPLWDKPRSNGANASHRYIQSERPVSTIHHFSDKLLRLYSELETPTARRLADRRTKYMSLFVEEFKHEWCYDLELDALLTAATMGEE